MGVDVLYQKMDSGNDADGSRLAANRTQVGSQTHPARLATPTTGHSGSASTATSIPDRLIMDVR